MVYQYKYALQKLDSIGVHHFLITFQVKPKLLYTIATVETESKTFVQ